MAQQLIFTSTPQGLEPGRTGYCTVARHKDLRHRLVRELERLSVYDFGQQTGTTKSDICIFRKIPLGSEEFYVLTKICDAGLDYTNRTNYLAHHLVLDGFEIATCPSPAEIFLNWNGWLSSWTDGPRFLGEEEAVTLSSFKSSGLVPCQAWLQVTNDPGNAASLISPDMVKPVVVEGNPGNPNTLLTLFAESCALLKISLDAWDFSFTTFLQGNDDSKTFAWIGIQGQPAGERLKQGGLRNYLDLRNWSASVLSDPIDPNLEHLARKGPTKAPAKKKPSTVAKAAFSEQELQRARASAPAQAAVPAGSYVEPQAATASTKEKKKRPWLLQLAVISTALCLLVALIVGLAYNLGDWFREEEDSSNGAGPVEPEKPPAPPPEERARSVAPDSPVQVDRAEYLKLVQTHFALRWVELDGGGDEPLRINLNEKQQDLIGKDLQQMKPGEELRVVIQRDIEEQDKLVFEAIEMAPEPEERGILHSVDLNERESVSLSEDEQTIHFRSGEKTYPLSLSLLEPSERRKMRKLYQLIQSGSDSPILFKPRVEAGRIVHYQPFDLPDPGGNPVKEPTEEVPVRPPAGKPVTLSAAKGDDFFEIAEKQRQIFLLVDKVTRTKLPYVFSEDERDRILALARFLEKGEQEVDLKIRRDGDQITSLEFELPAPPSIDPVQDSGEIDPDKLIPEKTIVFWIPGVKINESWNLDPRDNYSFHDAALPDYLANLMNSGASAGPGKAWMSDFEPRLLMERGMVGGFDFESFAYAREPDPLGDERITSFPFAQKVNGKNFYSFTFKVTKGASIEVDSETESSRNAIRNGQLIRIPNLEKEGSCLDLFFLSNKHADLLKPQKLGEYFSFRLGSLELSPPWLAPGRKFHLLTPKGTSESFLMGLSVASSAGSEKIRSLIDRTPEDLGWSGSDAEPLPMAFLAVSSQDPMRATLLSDQEYANKVLDKLVLQKRRQEDTSTGNLKKFGPREAWHPVFQYMTYSRKNGFAFKYQKLGEYVYESTFDNLRRKVLEEVRFKLLQSKLPPDFYRVDALAYEVRFAKTFWMEIAAAVKDQIENSIDLPRNYDDEIAARDVDRLFAFLRQMLHAEMAFGFSDSEGLYDLMQEYRNTLSLSTNEKSTIRRLQAQLQRTNSEAVKTLFANRLREFQGMERTLRRYAQLKTGDLELFSGILSDPPKYKQFLHYFNNASGGNARLDELLGKVEKRVSSPNLKVSQRAAFVNGVPWTLSVFRKNSAGFYEKQSDFLRLAPPQIQ
jgi:hypothetical protein